MSFDPPTYVEKLRARLLQDLDDARGRAILPVFAFAEDLLRSGEMAGLDVGDTAFVCCILASAHGRPLQAGGFSLQVSCTYAYPARAAGHVFWQMAVDAAGRKPRFFSGSSDYRVLFDYLRSCIVEQSARPG